MKTLSLPLLLLLLGCQVNEASTKPETQPPYKVIVKEPFRDLFNAIAEVETGGEKNPVDAVGDNGRSIGPYQIGILYWEDSGMEGHWFDVKDYKYAEETMLRYWRRWCPQALEDRNYEVLARTHNGGPRGINKVSTIVYWVKVRKHL